MPACEVNTGMRQFNGRIPRYKNVGARQRRGLTYKCPRRVTVTLYALAYMFFEKLRAGRSRIANVDSLPSKSEGVRWRLRWWLKEGAQ